MTEEIWRESIKSDYKGFISHTKNLMFNFSGKLLMENNF